MNSPGQPIPLIPTKWHKPDLPAGHIPRARLLQQLQKCLKVPLTLVSAPAGYGKSLLASEWAHNQTLPVAWLALDKTENPLDMFLHYLLAAIDTVAPGAMDTTRKLLGALEPAGPEQLLVSLISDLDSYQQPLVVVLDDYHLLDHGSAVQELLGDYSRHAPRNVHLILLTRRDPPLPLATMRARGEVLELRLDELCFNNEETLSLLSSNLDFAPDSEAVDKLQRLSEGWPAGLHLVILAALNADDPESLLSSLESRIKYIQDYLVEAVIDGLKPELGAYLYRAAIPDRFCAEMLDALGSDDQDINEAHITASDFLRIALDSNLFVISLDASGTWFRFHHLFRDLLLQKVTTVFAAKDIKKLYSRAIDWLEKHELVSEAIQQALMAADEERAVTLVERHCVCAIAEDSWPIVRSWLRLLPSHLVRKNVNLLLADAWVSHFQLDLEHLSWLLQQLDADAHKGSLTEDQRQQLNFFLGVAALHSGDSQASNKVFEHMISESFPSGAIAGEIQIDLALTRQMCGNTRSASDALKLELNRTDRNNIYHSRILAGEFYLAFISLETTGALHAAEQLSALCDEMDSNYVEAWAGYMRGLVLLNATPDQDACIAFNNVIRLQNDVQRRVVVDAFLGQALSLQLGARPDEAEQTMLRLQQWARNLRDARCSDLAATSSARLLLLQGDVVSAAKKVGSIATLPRTRNLLFWQEEPEITAIRVKLAAGKRSGVAAAIDTLAEFSEQVKAQHQSCQLVDILLLQAMALELSGARKSAQELLEQALEIAAPANWSRPFAEVGEALLPLIEAAKSREVEPEFADRLLATSAGSQNEQRPKQILEPELQMSEQTDALTNRELDILELLAQRYRNKEIADKLFISAHTVNYHLKHIYQKLGVSGRRQAVLKAIETGDLPS